MGKKKKKQNSWEERVKNQQKQNQQKQNQQEQNQQEQNQQEQNQQEQNQQEQNQQEQNQQEQNQQKLNQQEQNPHNHLHGLGKEGTEEYGIPQLEEKMKEDQQKNKSGKGRFFPICVGAAVFLLTVYISGLIYLSDKFLTNTIMNGIDISYHTVEEVEQKIADYASKYTLTLKERDDEEIITAADIGYKYVSKEEVRSFQNQQQLALWPISIWKVKEYTFDMGIEYSDEKLQETVDNLRCFQENVIVEPENAYLKLEEGSYVIIPEKLGKKVQKKRLKKQIKEAVSLKQMSLSLEEKNCYVKPEITKEDKNLNTILERLNHYTKAKIIYRFHDKKETLDGRIIGGWLSYDGNGQVTLDESKVAMYVDTLAAKHDTYGKPRYFIANDGTKVKAVGGNYGWLIDREAETEKLTKTIKQGAVRKNIRPVYAHTAVSRENFDLGHTYIEVDLTNQHLWMYVDGKEVVSSDIVSGTNSSSSRRTPGGTYSIYYKKSPAVLRSTTPGDSYETPVTYWMPFNGGIGLHDANWRGSFGGNIYQYNGSHGCVNLPYKAAKEIYQYADKGMPVILYYR